MTIPLLLSLFVLSLADCDVSFRQIRPSETGSDATATDGDAPHWVFAGSAAMDEPLRVFLPGTYGQPAGDSYLLSSIADCDKPTIGLSYAFLPLPDSSRNRACKDRYSTDVTARAICLADQHHDAIWGGDSQPDLWNNTAPQNSISGRLALLLAHLAARYPGEAWHSYLAGAQVRWDRIVMGGHSQGAGHSGYLAQTTVLRGAVLLSGPQDDSEVPNRWLDADVWATSKVVAAKHGNESAEDIIGDNWLRMARPLGWSTGGQPWELGDGLAPPPYGPVVSRVEPASKPALIGRPYHISMAVDYNTPIYEILPDGQERALYAMFLWPGLYTLASAHHHGDNVTMV